jgi:phosphatidylserine/phosphatidylglycerophosphate/cardiolipin synthase-like enzyme
MLLVGCGSAPDGSSCDATEQAAADELGQSCDAITFSTDTWCSGPLRRFGRCNMPNVTCASPLGTEIARATWEANHSAGTVPSHLLYGSKNASFGSFVDAAEVFPEMAKLIAGANSEVLIETFDWDPSVYSFADPKWDRDPTTILLDGMRRLEQRLRASNAPTVRVYLTFDGAHTFAPPNAGAPAVNKARKLFQQLASFGGFDPRYVELHVGAHERWGAGGLHSKTIVVDGYVAMVMGANPQTWQTIGQSWHDSGYGVLGEAGVALARNIDDTWKESTEVFSCDLTKLDGNASCDTQPARAIVHGAAPNLDADPRLANACLPVFVATKRAVGNSLTSLTLSDTSSPQDRAFLAIFQHAKNVIQIESPNMNARSAEETFAAAKRGVDMRVLLTYTFNSASERQKVGPISGGGSNEDVIRTLYQRMHADRSVCGHLDMRFVSHDGVRPIPQVEPGASHVKFMSADGQVAMVGSANQDMSSWELTRETNVVVDDSKVVAEWNGRVFDADWKHSVSAVDFAKSILARSDADVAADANLQTILIDPQGWARDVAGACN